MIGKKLGNRYELLEQLGGGGMAVVYKACDTYLDRMVTVKVLRSEYVSDEAFVARFRKEAQSVARLSHPNIVNIHDVGTEGDIHYLVMEYVDGENLKSIIRRRGPLPPAEVVRLVRQICDALQHAHDNNIVHRDVKPHNILVRTDGRAKLTDFGIAREASAVTLTYTNNFMGSVHYISPEQACGEVAGPHSDIYSLGIVVYEMLTGKVPFDGDTPIGVAMKHVQDELPPLDEINPALPRGIVSAVEKALAKDPRHRFQTAQEMAAALEEALRVDEGKGFLGRLKAAGLNLKALFGSNTRAMEKRRNLYLLLGLPALLVLLLAGVLFALGEYVDTPEVKVPDVTGLTYEDAKSVLEEQGLKARKAKEIFSDDYEEGTIISQEVGPDDAPVKKGRVIDLVVSKGPDLREVPSLIGMNETQAMMTLLKYGLVLSTQVNKQYNDQVEEGLVIEQNPVGGTFVKKGSEVQITVSLGPQPAVEVPDVIGMQEEQAKELLIENGLKISGITWETNSMVPRGSVIRQEPTPGTEVDEGTGVMLTLSGGPRSGTGRYKVVLEELIPDDGREHKVEIVVEDRAGIHREYEGKHASDEDVVKTVEYEGQAVIRVYVDGTLVKEEVAG